MSIKDFNNKKFNLFGSTWTIKLVDKIEENKDGEVNYYFGMTYHTLQKIEIAKYVNGNKTSEEMQQITLLHELIHVICSTGNYFTINNDEPFVEFMARSILSLLKQNIICK